ncbi:homeodomain-like domain protein [Leptospira weilii serovar Topaz str. LT2116]|uniref:Homeodomain-like domain protein n=1 Tax=Leptospira weilii serovar Topaz str. LT2116 TaxID=1088540 RepID=M3ERF9_9LEPT|nr:homeodomain-like domain protein [Leptospira weilii serovar Topaz str. LT2116]
MQKLEREKLKRLEKRRLKGIALLKKGYTCYGVSKKLGVSKQSVMRWRDKYESEGIEGVKWNGQRGRPTKLSISEKKELKRIILKVRQVTVIRMNSGQRIAYRKSYEKNSE